MNWKTIALGLIACSAAAPAPGQNVGEFHVRNETRQNLTCGLRRPRGSMSDLFVIRPGSTWTQAATEATPRQLRCDVNRLPLQATIHPGVSYVLAETDLGRVGLRVEPAS